MTIVAVDECGNASSPTRIGTVHVPHDAEPRAECLNAARSGCGNGAPLPCPRD